MPCGRTNIHSRPFFIYKAPKLFAGGRCPDQKLHLLFSAFFTERNSQCVAKAPHGAVGKLCRAGPELAGTLSPLLPGRGLRRLELVYETT